VLSGDDTGYRLAEVDEVLGCWGVAPPLAAVLSKQPVEIQVLRRYLSPVA